MRTTQPSTDVCPTFTIPEVQGSSSTLPSTNSPLTPGPASSPATGTTIATALGTAAATQTPTHLGRKRYRDKQSFEYIWRSLFAGGVAGCAAKTAVAPLDRVKILFQTNNPHFEKYSGTFFGVFRAAGDIHRAYGVRGLFQGHSATLLRIFPYAAIKFMVYEQIKHRITPTKESQTAFRNFINGSVAGCTSVFFSYPLDLLRVRLAFEVRGSTSLEPVKLRSVVRMVYNEQNPWWKNPPPSLRPLMGVTNFYRGFMPTLYGIIPYAGVSFLVYERLKTLAKTTLGKYTLQKNGHELTWWAYLTCGALSGAIAQTTAYPLEVIRRNMQVAGVVKEGNTLRRTTWQTAMTIWKRKGLSGLFVGLSIGYMKVMPMSAVSFFVYEWMKVRLGID
ncbi:mitochondrial carrier domain-containing protein [Gaertneriomyces semiglobifer]|nr:mitochondrial carrier domain-containing protein [Gaertneriomyces semiglobifer]